MDVIGGLGFLIPIAVIAIVVAAIAAAVTGRGDPDPSGQRAHALYLFGVSFVALFVALFATVAVVSAVTHIAAGTGRNEGGPVPLSVLKGYSPVIVGACPIMPPGVAPPRCRPQGWTSYGPLVRYSANREYTRAAVEAGIVALVAVGILWFHGMRARDLTRAEELAPPARRVYRSYLYASCFVAVVIGLFAAAAAAYGLFRIVAPGTTGQFVPSGFERREGIVQLVSAGFLAFASGAIFHFHWKRLPAAGGPAPLEPAPPIA